MSATEIKIRGFFGDWNTVTKEKAKSFVRMFYDNIVIGDHDYKVRLIEQRHLSGITYNELMK